MLVNTDEVLFELNCFTMALRLLGIFGPLLASSTTAPLLLTAASLICELAVSEVTGDVEKSSRHISKNSLRGPGPTPGSLSATHTV